MQDIQAEDIRSKSTGEDLPHSSTTASPDLDQYLLVRLARWLARRIGAFEAMLYASFITTVFLAGGFGAVVAVASLIGDWKQLAVLERAGSVTWAIGWVFLDMPCMFRLLLMAVRHRQQIALKTAMAQPMMPLVLRPVVTLWWAAHFLIAAWMAALIHSFNQGQNTSHCLVLLAAIGLGACANGFLMLSVCAATSSEHSRMTLWRFRLLIDIVIGSVGPFVVDHILPK